RNAKLGREEELGALKRLDDQARSLERHARGPSVEALIARERGRSPSYGGRSVFGWEDGRQTTNNGKESSVLRPPSSVLLSPQHLRDAAGLIGARHVEGGFPHRDLTVAHDPGLGAEAAHARAAVGVLPFAAPYVGDDVAHERAELFVEAIVLLPRAARRKERAQRFAAVQFGHGARAHDTVLGKACHQRLDVPRHE